MSWSATFLAMGAGIWGGLAVTTILGFTGPGQPPMAGILTGMAITCAIGALRY